MQSKVSFPWSMIDKITPRPDAKVQKMLEEDGFEDTDTIITDTQHLHRRPLSTRRRPQYLVIEDEFPNGRPRSGEGRRACSPTARRWTRWKR